MTTQRYIRHQYGVSCVDRQPLYCVRDTLRRKDMNFGILHEDGSRSFQTRDSDECDRNVQRMNDQWLSLSR